VASAAQVPALTFTDDGGGGRPWTVTELVGLHSPRSRTAGSEHAEPERRQGADSSTQGPPHHHSNIGGGDPKARRVERSPTTPSVAAGDGDTSPPDGHLDSQNRKPVNFSHIEAVTVSQVDSDADGVEDSGDNCRRLANPDQGDPPTKRSMGTSRKGIEKNANAETKSERGVDRTIVHAGGGRSVEMDQPWEGDVLFGGPPAAT